MPAVSERESESQCPRAHRGVPKPKGNPVKILPWLPFPTSLEANDAGQERSTAVEHAIGTSAAQADCRVPITGYDRLTAPKVI